MDDLKEFLGTMLFAMAMFAFATLCVVGSGYHWE